MDSSAELTTLLEHKVYYVLMPLLPGGLLLLCVLAGKPELRSVLLYSEGFGYIFRISLLVGIAWVLGGVLFLVSLIVIEAATGIIAGLAERGGVVPWNVPLWRRAVTAAFDTDMAPTAEADKDWKLIYEALEKTFPDSETEIAEMLTSLVLSAAMAVCLGTIWWRAARLPAVYVAVIVVLAITGFVVYVYAAPSSESSATRQVGALLHHRLQVEKKKDANSAVERQHPPG
jgi:hypothetical protein